MGKREARARSERAARNDPKPFDFDGPFEDKDPYGANFYVEVRFLSRKDADDWINARYKELDANIEVYEEPLGGERKGVLKRMFGL